MRKYPPIVSKLCYCFDGWIIGGAAKDLDKPPRDYDVIIPYYLWHQASIIIPQDAKINSFGGWKFIDDGFNVDVWPDDITRMLKVAMVEAVYHPQSGTRFIRSKQNG